MIKTKSFLKTLGIGLGLVGVVAPVSTVLTSCFSIDDNYFYEIDFNQVVPTSINQMHHSNVSFSDLINGDKSVHDGNYIIILASNVSEESNFWFTGYKDHQKDYQKDGVFASSAYLNAMNSAKSTYLNGQDFGIYLYFDIETQKDADKCAIGNQEYYAYNYTWTDSDVEWYQQQPGKQDDDKTIVSGKYARTDKSAKAMRSITSDLTTLFGSSDFTYSGPSGLPYAMTWKDGVPQTTSDYWKSLTTDNDLINIITYLGQQSSDK